MMHWKGFLLLVVLVLVGLSSNVFSQEDDVAKKTLLSETSIYEFIEEVSEEVAFVVYQDLDDFRQYYWPEDEMLGDFWTAPFANSTTGTKAVNYWAVIAAVADYPGVFNDLDYTDDDARDVYNSLLIYSGNWSSTNIRLLINAAASKNGIKSAINNIGNSANSDDVVFFFFSGHGTNGYDIAPCDEADGYDEYLCAYDADIRDDELGDWFGALPTNNVIVIIDACFSGGVIKSNDLNIKSRKGTPSGLVKKGDGFTADFKRETNRKDLNDNAGYVVLTACDDDELSYEFSQIKNGLFTWALITPQRVAYDFNSNGEISAEELYVHANTVMQDRGLDARFNQHPQLHDDYPAGNSGSDELGLIFPSRKASLAHFAGDSDQAHELLEGLTFTVARFADTSVVSDNLQVIEDGFIRRTDATMNLSLATPTKFSLGQNQPNPVSDLTTISYSLAANSHVKLQIYNVSGQLVKNLIDDRQESGFYKVVWDGKDDNGIEVTSGIYLYKIQVHTGLGTGNYTEMKKMIVVH